MKGELITWKTTDVAAQNDPNPSNKTHTRRSKAQKAKKNKNGVFQNCLKFAGEIVPWKNVIAERRVNMDAKSPPVVVPGDYFIVLILKQREQSLGKWSLRHLYSVRKVKREGRGGG